jgi:hypothetical protein
VTNWRKRTQDCQAGIDSPRPAVQPRERSSSTQPLLRHRRLDHSCSRRRASGSPSRRRWQRTRLHVRPVCRTAAAIGRRRTSSSSSGVPTLIPGTSVARLRCASDIFRRVPALCCIPRWAAAIASMTCRGCGRPRRAATALRGGRGPRSWHGPSGVLPGPVVR